ncbi:MAG: hypothetical protein AB1758_29465, partial [Candidatus Eremiobacterota bacterium]
MGGRASPSQQGPGHSEENAPRSMLYSFEVEGQIVTVELEALPQDRFQVRVGERSLTVDAVPGHLLLSQDQRTWRSVPYHAVRGKDNLPCSVSLAGGTLELHYLRPGH